MTEIEKDAIAWLVRNRTDLQTVLDERFPKQAKEREKARIEREKQERPWVYRAKKNDARLGLNKHMKGEVIRLADRMPETSSDWKDWELIGDPWHPEKS